MKKKGILARMFGGQEKEVSGDADDFSTERREMIRGVHELSQTSVKEVMVPRIDVEFLPMEAESGQAIAAIVESGHSRIPIYRDTIDNVVGVLHVKDMVKHLAGSVEFKLEELVRKPYFVPESKHLDSLLREFRRRHVHIAIAVDEYGGTSGIVCMEDILEVIVGDIQDEFDNEREDILAVGEGVWICDGRVNLGDLNDELGISLPTEEVETLGGFVFDLFGKIPVKYEKMSWGDHDFIIQDMDGHKINTVKVVRRAETGEAGK